MAGTNFQFMRTLVEREPMMEKLAEQAKAEGRLAMSIYYRTLAYDAAQMYALVVGDNPRAALAEHKRHLLENDIRKFDSDHIDYLALKAQAEMDVANVSA